VDRFEGSKAGSTIYADLAEYCLTKGVELLYRRKFNATTLANEWAFKLDPKLRKPILMKEK
jgi:hypothetical protein